VLLGLSHGSVGCCNDDDGAVHLSSTGDHVLDVVSVTRAVNVSIVPVGGLILNVSGVNGNTTLFFFRGVVNCIVSECLIAEQFCTVHGNCCGKGSLTMVNVTDGSYVYVWLVPLKFLFCHHFLLVTFHRRSQK